MMKDAQADATYSETARPAKVLLGGSTFLVPTVESVGHAFFRRQWSAFTFARFTVGEIAEPFGGLRH